MADIRATGAEIVVASNTGCHMQLLAGVRRAGLERQRTERARHARGRAARNVVPQRGRLAGRVEQENPDAQDGISADDWKALQGALPKSAILTNPVELIPYEVDGSLGLRRSAGRGACPERGGTWRRSSRWAAERGIPLIARGAGTGLSGGAVAPHGGVMVSLARMKQVAGNGRSRPLGRRPARHRPPGAGRVRKDQGALLPARSGQRPRVHASAATWPRTPGGPHCFKYGVTTNYVAGLQVVLAGRPADPHGRAGVRLPRVRPDRAAGRARRGRSASSREAQLRLVRNVPGIKTLMAIFDSVETAGEAVSAVITRGLVPATLEMMDRTMIGIVENYVHAGLPVDAEALLIIEADGHPASLDSQMAEIVEVLKAQGARELRLAQNAGRAGQDLVRAEERIRRHRADQPGVPDRRRHRAPLEAGRRRCPRSTASAPRTICGWGTSSMRATATCTRSSCSTRRTRPWSSGCTRRGRR